MRKRQKPVYGSGIVSENPADLSEIKRDGGLHRYFLGSAPNPGDRPQILVSPADADRINNLPHGLSDATATVYDHNSKKPMLIRRASCGLRCICALEVVVQ